MIGIISTLVLIALTSLIFYRLGLFYGELRGIAATMEIKEDTSWDL